MPIARFTTVRISAMFYNSAGTAVDPTVVTFRIKDPSGELAILTYPGDAAVVRDATGAYHIDYLPPTSGDYAFHWRGTGAVVASEDGSFTVSPSTFAA